MYLGTILLYQNTKMHVVKNSRFPCGNKKGKEKTKFSVHMCLTDTQNDP